MVMLAPPILQTAPRKLTWRLAGYWPCDETPGGNRREYIRDNTAVDTNTVLATTGPGTFITTAADFEKDNTEYLLSPDHSSYRIANRSFSAAIWFKAESVTLAAEAHMLASFDASGGWLLYLDADHYPAFFCRKDGVTTQAVNITSQGAVDGWLNTWAMLAGTYNAGTGTMTVYLCTASGIFTNTATLSSVADYTGGISLSDATAGRHDGALAAAGFWVDRVLTERDVRKLYGGGNGPLLYGGQNTGTQLLADLAGYWPLDEASGTREDDHGASDLTDVNTVTGAAGPNAALPLASQFTAANSEQLTAADSATLSVEGQDFSFAVWVYLDAIGANRGIAAKDDNSAGNREWYLRYNNSPSRFRFALQNSTTNIALVDANTFGAPSTGTWYFLVGTFKASTRAVTFSVNAASRQSATATGDITASGALFRIGNAFGSFMDGRLAGAGLWKRVLTNDEEAYLYNNGSGRAYDATKGFR